MYSELCILSRKKTAFIGQYGATAKNVNDKSKYILYINIYIVLLMYACVQNFYTKVWENIIAEVLGIVA